ncbi:PhnA domain-containing protein [Hydrogenimonas thermophila]|uniref:Phosphonoacetate hydrolase n=1 Tax=Hydrogenimonas thermophila TaxID=223786 RepID=A0A1I5PFB8_9BACT|nr:alkylphosphonate utilization protein [Hydrogenimonas thermophila]WOE70765.1 PhnA domain-containing protein [Hydrogenimonas thermophila]WOE73283.1 PhnA domain-containing protein [Hydrogenimonas thermophila]SFP32231.1 phosphonoacetate hydrolase [Hydrogenimonas thermophila]
MGIKEELIERSGGKCELCSSTDELDVFEVTPSDGSADKSIFICKKCREQISNPESIDPNHWHCLNESMWSTVPAVQVMAYRILKQISSEGWPQDLLDMLYLEPEVQTWADAEINEIDGQEPTRDSNGTVLQEGDSVTIIKDLDVKGAGFTAKRGTVVKNIHLTSNPEQIEGRVNGVKIVLLSKFLKKA